MPLRLVSLAQGRRFHCTALALAAVLVTTGPAAAQGPELPATGDATFAIYVKGVQIGREQANVARGPSGWIITSTGRTEAPLDFTIARFEAKYAPDWQPLELTLEARLRTAVATVKTSFALTTAINEVTQNSKTVSKEDQISAKTVVLPNNVFGGVRSARRPVDHDLARRGTADLRRAAGRGEAQGPHLPEQALTGPGRSIRTRRYDVTFVNPDRPIDAVVDRGRPLAAGSLRAAGAGPAGGARGRRERRAAAGDGPQSRPTGTPLSRPTASISRAPSRRLRAWPGGSGTPRSFWSAERRRAIATR